MGVRKALHYLTIVMVVLSLLGTTNLGVVLAAPNAQWDPNSWDFGGVVVGQTSTRTFALRNTGTTTITLGSTASASTVAGPGTFTVLSNNCLNGTSLLATELCTVDVRFNPVNTTATTTGTLVVDVTGIGTITASLQGYAATTGLTVSPGSLVFGNQQVGSTSPAQTVTVKNTTAGPVVLGLVSSSPVFPPYQIQTDGCSTQTLAPNASCAVSVTFSPNTAGPAPAGSLTITSNASPGVDNVALSGTGVDPVPALNPSSLDFGSQPVSTTSAAKTILLVNTTGQSLVVNAAPTLLSGVDFLLNSNTCTAGTTLASGASCSADILFTPGATPGPYVDTVQFSTTAGGALQTLQATVFGIATVGALTVSPGTVNFGTVTVGANSAAQTITITNLGGGPATITGAITSANFSGGNANNFDVIASGCPVGPATLAAGASCNVAIRFTPSAQGNRSSTLQIPTGSGTLQVTVNGVGDPAPVAAAVLSVTPGALNFGSVQQGQPSGGQVITIANTGTASLTLTNSASITGGNNADFTTIANTCGATLAAGASCDVTVRFTPGGTGNRASTLQVVTPIRTATVLLNGVGTAAPVTAPGIGVSPAAVSFGNQQVGTTSGAKSVTVTNTGTANLTISSIAFAGGNTGDFSNLASNCTPGPITPGASCEITLTFAPAAGSLGNRSTTIAIVSDAPTKIVPVDGVGVSPSALIAPAVVDFGSVVQGQPSAGVPVTISNTGSAPITITGAITSGNISGANSADFAVIASSCPASPAALAPGASCTVLLRFTPGGTGGRTSALQVTTSAGLLQATLNGNGTAAPVLAPALSFNPAIVNFGDQTVGATSNARFVTVTNTGTANVVFSAAPALSGGNTGDFAVAGNTCPASPNPLTPGSQCTVTVTFTPGASGQRTAGLLFTDNVPSAGSTQIVTLVGNGVASAPSAPGIAFDPASVSFGNQTVGTTSGARTITVRNTGNAALTISSVAFAGGNTGDFANLQTNCTPGSVAPGASCEISLAFAPAAGSLGYRSTTIAVVSNAPTAIVPVNGVGVAAGAPAASVAPASVNFGTVQIGQVSAAVPVMLTNTGSANLSLSAAPSVTGTDAGQFGIVSDGCGTATLAPNASCTVTVRFAPTGTAAARSATLSFPTNASGSPHLANLTGTSVAAPVVAPFAVVSPPVIDFGAVQQGQVSGGVPVTITNTGTANLVFGGGTPIALASTTNFSIVTNGCPGAAGTLAPGASCTVVVRFSPPAAASGNLTTTLSVHNNSAGGSPQLVVLNGFAAPTPVTAPFATLSAASLSFGNQTVGTPSAAQAVTITNTGTANLVFSAAPGIGGADAGQFQIVTDGCGATTLTPNASCTVTVRFNPTSTGQKSATLVFASNISGTYSLVNLTGNGVAAGVPAITLDPTAVAFGNVPVGNSAVQVVTATNSGGGPLTFGTVAVAGTGFSESGDTCQGVTLQPGQSCQIAVIFAPGTATALSGTLTFNDNAPAAGSSQVVNLGGTGTSALLTFAPAPLDFGNVAQGASSTLGVAVTNVGGQALAIGTVGGLGGDFTLVSTTCANVTLAPAATCAVVVRYSPSGVGLDTDTIDVALPGPTTVSSAVVGNGVAAPTPAISFSPAVLNFGNVAVQTAVAETVTFTNTGNAPLTISDFNNPAAPYSVSGNGCASGITLQPNQSCTFAVTFAPTTTGAQTDFLTVSSNASGSPHRVNLRGFGVSSVIAFTPPPVHFGNVTVGGGSTLGLLVTNLGGGPVTISGVGGLAPPFSIEGDTCTGLTLAPNASCVLDIKFQPTAPGYAFDSVTVTTGAGTYSAVVDGTGVAAPTPAITITPGAVAFGNVPVGGSASQTVTIKNTGGAAFTVNTVGGLAAPLAITGNGCTGTVLNPNDTCTFTVTFSPTAVGPASGTVSIASTLAASPHTVGVSGNGVSSVLSFVPSPLDFGNVAVGTTATRGVLVTNTGGGPVAIATVSEQVAGGPITVVSTTCAGATLAPNASCVVNVQFAPTATGTVNDQIQLNNATPALIAASAVVGTGVAAATPTVTFEPTSLDFGNVQIGTTSAAKTLTIRNSGNAPLVITTLGTSGAPFALSANGCANATLQPGQSCTVGVTFSPTVAGAVTGTLQVNDNAGGSATSQFVSLTGFGVTSGPAIAFDPSALDFGSIPVNTSATRTLTVKNTGTAPLIINTSGPVGVVIVGTGFSLTGNGCTGATLLPGETCTVGVTFAPPATGAATGTLTFNSNAPASPQVVNLSGTGTSAVFTFNPAALNFGPVQVNTTATLTTLVTNRTGGPARITGIAGLGGTPFVLLGDGCTNVTLPDGASCALTFTFTPTAAQYYAASVTLNLSTGGSVTLALTGNGVAQPTPLLSITPASLDFGYVQVGQTAPAKAVTVKNVGAIDVAISNAAVAGAGFAEASDTCQGQVLQPGQSCTVGVTFTPGSAAPLSGTLTFTDNAPSGTQVVALFGNGITAGLGISPASLNFGNVQVGSTSAAQTVTVTNTGGGPVSITNFGPTGADAGQYEVVGNTCITGGFPATLQPGASCTFGVRFKPTSAGPKGAAQLSITSTAAGNPQTVGLNGVGVTPAFTLSASGLDFGNVVVGQTSATQTITLTNSTNGPLTLNTATTSAATYLISGDTCSNKTIAAGQSCQIGVQFRPAAIGADNQALTIAYDNGLGAPVSVVVQLTGNGIGGLIGVNANALNFGYQQVGTTSAAKTITVTNTSGSPLPITSAVVLNGGHFAETGDTCQGQTLPANGTCSIGVTFTPTTPGQKNDILRITYSNGATSVSLDIALAGIGVSPALTLTPSGLDFGPQQQNTSSPARTVIVKNSTNGPLQIGNSAIGNGSHFLKSGDTCNGLTLAPGQECAIGVVFRPTATGPLADTLVIPYGDGQGNAVNVTVQLTGIGTNAAISVAPASLDFGNVQLGSRSAAKTVTVKNIGGGPLTVNAPAIAGVGFTIVDDTCSGTLLLPAQECTIGVYFAPGSAQGPQTGTLTVNSTAPSGPQTVSLTGVGVTAGFGLSAQGLDFGTVPVGQSSPVQTVTLTNNTTGPLSISTVGLATGTHFLLSGPTCANSTIPAGATCQIGVQFRPTNATPAAKTDLLQVTYSNGATTATLSVNLTGNAVTVALEVTPPSLDFGNVPADTQTPAQTVTIRNLTGGPVTLGTLTTTGPFGITSDDCSGRVLAAGATCTVGVYFTAALPTGQKAGTLVIPSDAPTVGSSQTVSLTGVVIAPLTPLAQIVPASLDFGYQQVGTRSPAKVVTVTNVGTGVLSVASVAIAPGGANFTIYGDLCTGQQLNPGQSCTVGVVFQPNTPGAKTGTLTFTDNAPTAGSTQTVSLSGVAVSPALGLSANGLNFGYVQVGSTSAAQTVVVTNSTNGPITLSNPTILGGAHFIETGDTCNGLTMQAGQSCTVGVAFRPTATGPQLDTLRIQYGDGQGNTVNVDVTLTGIGITAGLRIVPSSLDFGYVQVGTSSAAQTVTVTNTGSGPVDITAFGLTGADAAQYEVVNNTCVTGGFPATLPPGANCTFGVRFKPTTPGAKNAAQLSITSTAAGNPQTVGLSGVGVSPALGLSANGLDFGFQQVGTSSAAKSVTITNSTAGPITLGNPTILNGAHFLESGDTCAGLTMQPGQSCTISVVFRPAATGPQADTLRIPYGDGQGNTLNVDIVLTGSGVTAQLTITPSSLDFGNVQVGAVSAAQTITVKNTGNGPVAITGVVPGGVNSADFELLNNTCFSAGNGATLAPGASCTIAVRFAPGSTGAKSATVAISDSASGTPQVVGLSGVGISPAIALAPASLDFGNQQAGTTSPAKTVTITNTSNGPLTITSVVSNNGQFQVVGNTCGSQTIAPGASCTISVVFAPTSTGPKAATLTITDSTNTGSHLVSLTGVGVTAALGVNPASLDFGNQQVSTVSPAKTVTVTNTGSGPLDITTIGLAGADAGQFQIVANTCAGATLPANGTCTVSVVFAPTSAGAKSATLTIANSASATPQTVSLTGNGITGALTFQPVAVNFGAQQVNTTATQAIVVTNSSGSPVTFSAVALSGGSSPAFSLTGNTCLGATLPAGASCTVGVNFTPGTVGQHFGSVIFTDTAAGSPHVVTLSGQGIGTPTPVVEITPASLDFGNQQVGTTSPAKTVTIKNNGTATLTISNVAITIGGADFTKIADTCIGQTVNPGQSCTVSVVFNPTVGGPRAGLLTLTDNVPSAGSTQTISLTGNGVTGALTVSPASLAFGDQQVGTSSAAQTLTVQNTGAATLTINSVSVNSTEFILTGANCQGVTLTVGESCQIGVIFRPTSAGPKAASITIVHTAPGSPTTISLTGNGVSPRISLSAGSLDFPAQQLNTSSPAKTLTITNVSNGPLQISTIASDNPEFQVFANTCASQSLAPGASCTVSVVFRPTTAGQRTGTLTITDSTAAGSHTVSLTGLGVTTAVTLSAANFQFGSHQVGTTSPAQTLTVRNSGENALTISAVQIVGAHPADFIKSGDTCLGATLAPGQECQVSVSFSPTTGGTRSATLQLTDSAPGSPRTVVLGGVGITPAVTFEPLSLDFGQVAVGATSAAQTVTLTNTSGGPLTISTVVSTSAAFVKGADTCAGATLPTNGTCQVAVTFQPTATGQANGTLLFNTTVGSGQQAITMTGLGVAAATPTIGLSASTIAFGAQPVGTQSVTQTLTLTNTGNVPVTISAVTLNGTNPSDFVLYGNSCVGATLAAGGSCQIGIAFKPTATGNRGATLRIDDSAAGSPRTVALLGIGTAPTLGVSAPSLEFGPTQVGATSAPQTVTLTNTSGGSVALSAVVVTGLHAGDFNKTLDTCSTATLAPNATCSITARFAPTAGGSRNGGLLVMVSGGATLTIGLNGLGVTAQIAFDPSAVSFGTQPVTTMSSFQTVRLTNGGSGPLSITAVSLTGGDIGDFVVAGDTCAGGTLAPGGSCRVNVAFRPTATGNRFANLTFSTNVGNGTQTVPLQGVGTTTPTPAVQLSTQGMTFDPQQVGTQSAIQSIVVTNGGTANLVISGVAILGNNLADFAKTGDNCSGVTVAPGASCSLGIRFTPTQAGTRSANLTFITNAGNGTQTVSLVGVGITPTVFLSASSFTFGQQTVGVASAGQTLQVTNTGNGTLSILSVTLAGVNAGDFSKNADSCAGAVLAPGLSCTIGLIFRPQTVGNKAASILINDNAPGAPREIVLSGEGVQVLTPSVNLSANSLNFGTIQVGNVSTGQTLIVTNSGSGPLRITAAVLTGLQAADFLKTGDTCGNATIAPQNSCSIGIIFRPTTAGVRVAGLTLFDDAAGSPREITLTGTGLTGAVGLSAGSLDFGGQTIGVQSGTQTLVITNTGQGVLTLGAVTVAGGNAGDWKLLANTCVNATIAAGESCQIGVAFKPTAQGDRSATLTIANTAAGSVHNIALLGNGLLAQPRYALTLTFTSLGCNGTITLPDNSPATSGTPYDVNTVLTLRVNPQNDNLFLGWRINGLAAGWANPLTITLTRDTAAEAVCVPKIAFTDTAGNPYLQAIYELTARGIIRGYTPDGCTARGKVAPCFGPEDTTLRAQMAALIARAMGWDLEDHGNGFGDGQGIDPNLWRNVGTLAYYGVAYGYSPTTFGPNDQVTMAQTISFITRAMVVKGYWQRQPDNPALYPSVPAPSGHRIDIATFVYYVGALPGTASTGGAFNWSAPATRAWFSQSLWLALNSYFGRDTNGYGGYVP